MELIIYVLYTLLSIHPSFLAKSIQLTTISPLIYMQIYIYIMYHGVTICTGCEGLDKNHFEMVVV